MITRGLVRSLLVYTILFGLTLGSGCKSQRIERQEGNRRATVEEATPKESEDGRWIPIPDGSETWYLNSKPEKIIIDEDARLMFPHLLMRKGQNGATSTIIFKVPPEADIEWATGADPNNWQFVEPNTLAERIFLSWYEEHSGEPGETLSRDKPEQPNEIPPDKVELKVVPSDDPNLLKFNFYNGSEYRLTSLTVEICQFVDVNYEENDFDVNSDPPRLISASSEVKKFRKEVNVPPLSSSYISFANTEIWYNTLVSVDRPGEGSFASVKVLEARGQDS